MIPFPDSPIAGDEKNVDDQEGALQPETLAGFPPPVALAVHETVLKYMEPIHGHVLQNRFDSTPMGVAIERPVVVADEVAVRRQKIGQCPEEGPGGCQNPEPSPASETPDERAEEKKATLGSV